MTTAYICSTGTSVARVDDFYSIGFEGQPAGVAVIINLDRVGTRTQLLASLAALTAAVLADKPLG